MAKKRYVGILSIDDEGEGIIDIISEESATETSTKNETPYPLPGRS